MGTILFLSDRDLHGTDLHKGPTSAHGTWRLHSEEVVEPGPSFFDELPLGKNFEDIRKCPGTCPVKALVSCIHS